MFVSDVISIVIPIYNVKDYLRRNLDAVMAQSYENLEVILVDDGATDGSGVICDEYAAKDNRFHVIHKKNGGTSSARNAGIEAATGAFVGFLDSDDWPEPDMYENLHQAFLKYPEGKIAQLMSRDFLPDGTMVKGPQRDSGNTHFLPVKDYFEELMRHVGDSSFCTKLFRADFIKKYHFEENKLNEDFELLLHMIPKIDGVITVDKVGYNIELSVSSNTRGKFKAPLYEAMMENAKKAYELGEKLFPECQEVTKRFVLVQSLDYMLHVPVEQMKKENGFYQQEKKRIQTSKAEIKSNHYLDRQQRRNLKILSIFDPKLVRSLHNILMKLKGVR